MAFSASGQSSDTLIVESKIKAVTVFIEGAQVERQHRETFKKGKLNLKFAKLPLELDPKSIQVKSDKGSTILSVKHAVRSYKPKETMTESDLRESIKRHTEIAEDLNNELSVFNYEENLLLKNDNFRNENGGVAVNDIREAADFYRSRLNEVRIKKMTISRKVDSIKLDIQGFEQRINRMKSANRSSYSEILVELDVPKNGTEKIFLSYYVPSAGWKPYYDFRVKNVQSPLSITYLAKVYQSSGEDWKNVEITLSNINPKLKGARPEMQRWIFGQNSNGISFGNSLVQIAKPGLGQYYSSGGIKGIVTDKSSGEHLPFVNVSISKNGSAYSGASTDFDGMYLVKPLDAGAYDVAVNFVGYKPTHLSRVQVQADRITSLNIPLEASAISLEQFEVAEYSVPLIDKDGRGNSNLTVIQNNMQRLPSVRGSRSSSMQSKADIAYIEGVTVKSLSSQKISRNGGHPASFGDASGGMMSTSTQRNAVGNTFKNTNLIENSLKTSVSNVQYRIDVPYTVMSDGYDHSMRIKEVNAPASYLHHALPKLDPDVFLVAQIVDWDQLKLLSGEFNIFYEGTYIGKSFLDVQQTVDTLEIDLGRDKQVIVSRELDEEQYQKIKHGNYMREDVSFKLTVRNNKSEPIRLILKDQVPVSNKKWVTIETIDLADAKYDENKGFLEWDLGIKPASKREITYSYNLRYPRK